MKVLSITPILNVSDVPASIKWFETLGWQRSFSWNEGGMIAEAADENEHGRAHFAGICNAEAQIFLCRGGQGSRGVAARFPGDEDTGGVWISVWVESPEMVDSVHEIAKKHGMNITWPPTDEPWGVRECRLQHPDGHTLRISAGIQEK